MKFTILQPTRMILTLIVLIAFLATAQERSSKGQVPEKIMKALKAKFPNAVIQKWTKEKEGDINLYDIEFTQNGVKLEADIKEDGVLHNWEKEIVRKDLPEAVRKAFERAYPKLTFSGAMTIMVMKDGKEIVEGYEVTLKNEKKGEIELTVAPDGKIVEDSGKKEKKE